MVVAGVKVYLFIRVLEGDPVGRPCVLSSPSLGSYCLIPRSVIGGVTQQCVSFSFFLVMNHLIDDFSGGCGTTVVVVLRRKPGYT